MDLTLVMFLVLAFLAVVLSLEGLYNIWSSRHGAEARRLKARMAALSGESFTELAIERTERLGRFPWFQALLEGSDVGKRMSHWVNTSGAGVTAGELLLLSIGLGLLGLLAPGLTGRPAIFGPVLALIFGAIPWLRASSLRNKRIKAFENQFPEALDLMCRALRAGHAFPTAVKLAGEEIPEPLGKDFRILFEEMNYGVPMTEAMSRLAQRVPLSDVSFFVVAVLIQRESGGNLAELLENISSIVRGRLKLLGDVRTLAAEGKMSAQVLTALPFGVGLAVNMVNPEFMSVLWTDPGGQRVVAVALFFMVLGILWMRKIIDIRV